MFIVADVQFSSVYKKRKKERKSIEVVTLLLWAELRIEPRLRAEESQVECRENNLNANRA